MSHIRAPSCDYFTLLLLHPKIFALIKVFLLPETIWRNVNFTAENRLDADFPTFLIELYMGMAIPVLTHANRCHPVFNCQ
jgi:hypothetical protein